MAARRLVAQIKDLRDATACLRPLAYQAQESVYVIVVAGACKVASVNSNADWIPKVPYLGTWIALQVLWLMCG